MEPKENTEDNRTTYFMKLLTSHQPQIYAYISAAMFGDSAAADVLQETNLHLWEKAAQYDASRPFLPWAFGFARQSLMAHRKKCGRSRLVFCDESLDLLADHCLRVSCTLDDRLAALQKCLRRLSTAHAELISERYTAKSSVQKIAERLNDSARSVSSRLYRIRKALADCVSHTLASEEA